MDAAEDVMVAGAPVVVTLSVEVELNCTVGVPEV